MAAFNITSEGALLVIYASGILSSGEIIGIIDTYYANGIVKDVIWDISIGSLASISDEGYKAIAHAAHEALKNGARTGGRTAYVGHDDLEYGLLKMYTAIATTSGIPISYNVFRTIREAREWLAEPRRELESRRNSVCCQEEGD